MTQVLEVLFGALLLGLFVFCLWIPAWWLASRLDARIKQSLIRFPLSVGIALVAYLTFVNLLGKLLENSQQAVLIYLAINLTVFAVLLWRNHLQLGMGDLWRRKSS